MKTELVRAVVVITGNGGGVLQVKAVDMPREEWESEPREYIEANMPPTLGDFEGYEVMSAADALDLSARLAAAAGALKRFTITANDGETYDKDGRATQNCQVLDFDVLAESKEAAIEQEVKAGRTAGYEDINAVEQAGAAFGAGVPLK